MRSETCVFRLEPLEPVPTVISVGVRFSDERGATYSGSLPPFSVSFQDLFLPVCAFAVLAIADAADRTTLCAGRGLWFPVCQ